MDVPNLGQVGIGTVIGLIITQGVAALGHVINSRSTIKVKDIDDRAQLTHDLLGQLEMAFKELGLQKIACQNSQNENIVLVGVIISVDAEVRVIRGTLTEISRETARENPNQDYLSSLFRSMTRSVARIEMVMREARDTSASKLLRHNFKEEMTMLSDENGNEKDK
jgi:hypothetical protein